MTGRGYYGAVSLAETLSGIGDQYARLVAQKRAEAAQAAATAAANAREDARYKSEIERQNAADVAYAQTYNDWLQGVNPSTYTAIPGTTMTPPAAGFVPIRLSPSEATPLTVPGTPDGGFTLPPRTDKRALPSFLTGGRTGAPTPLSTPAMGRFTSQISTPSTSTARYSNPLLRPIPLTPAGGRMASSLLPQAMRAIEEESDRERMNKLIEPILASLKPDNLPEGLSLDNVKEMGIEGLDLIARFYPDSFKPQSEGVGQAGYLHGAARAAQAPALSDPRGWDAWYAAQLTDIDKYQGNFDYWEAERRGFIDSIKARFSSPLISAAIPLSRPGGRGRGSKK